MQTVCRPVSVATRSPTGETNAYLLGRDPAVLVDPAGRTDALDAAVADRGVEHVLVTHSHPDHVGAVATYAGETGATVWARRGYADRFREAAGVEPDRRLTPGTTIPADEGRVRVLDAPGHAPGHLAFVAGESGPICVGDCAVSEGSVAVAAPEGDVRAYLTTLRRLRARDPPRLLPGHGPPIDDPRAALERLLAHRLERERRVLSAVRAGARTPDELVDRAYEKDLEGVRDLARATVLAHLEKLAVERKVTWDGNRARPH